MAALSADCVGAYVVAVPDTYHDAHYYRGPTFSIIMLGDDWRGIVTGCPELMSRLEKVTVEVGYRSINLGAGNCGLALIPTRSVLAFRMASLPCAIP